MSDTTCKDCNGELVTKEDGGGKYQVCRSCGLRQDGLGQLQKRFSL